MRVEKGILDILDKEDLVRIKKLLVMKNRAISANKRTESIPLKHPKTVRWGGRTITINRVYALGVTFDSRGRFKQHTGNGSSRMQYLTRGNGTIALELSNTTPQGACVMAEACRAFVTTYRIFNSKYLQDRNILTRVPLGIAEFTDPGSVYEYPTRSYRHGQIQKVGCYIYGCDDTFQNKCVKRDEIKSGAFGAEEAKHMGAVLRDLHAAATDDVAIRGIFHRWYHPGNYFYNKERSLALVQDLGGCLVAAKDMGDAQFLAEVVADLFYAASKLREESRRVGIDENALSEAFLAGYMGEDAPVDRKDAWKLLIQAFYAGLKAPLMRIQGSPLLDWLRANIVVRGSYDEDLTRFRSSRGFGVADGAAQRIARNILADKEYAGLKAMDVLACRGKFTMDVMGMTIYAARQGESNDMAAAVPYRGKWFIRVDNDRLRARISGLADAEKDGAVKVVIAHEIAEAQAMQAGLSRADAHVAAMIVEADVIASIAAGMSPENAGRIKEKLWRERQDLSTVQHDIAALAGAMAERLEIDIDGDSLPSVTSAVPAARTSSYSPRDNAICIYSRNIGDGWAYGEEIMHAFGHISFESGNLSDPLSGLSEDESGAATEFMGTIGRYLAKDVSASCACAHLFAGDDLRDDWSEPTTLRRSLKTLKSRVAMVAEESEMINEAHRLSFALLGRMEGIYERLAEMSRQRADGALPEADFFAATKLLCAEFMTAIREAMETKKVLGSPTASIELFSSWLHSIPRIAGRGLAPGELDSRVDSAVHNMHESMAAYEDEIGAQIEDASIKIRAAVRSYAWHFKGYVAAGLYMKANPGWVDDVAGLFRMPVEDLVGMYIDTPEVEAWISQNGGSLVPEIARELRRIAAEEDDISGVDRPDGPSAIAGPFKAAEASARRTILTTAGEAGTPPVTPPSVRVAHPAATDEFGPAIRNAMPAAPALKDTFANVYKSAKDVIEHTRYPEKQRIVCIPMSEKICPSAGVRAQAQEAWKQARGAVQRNGFADVTVIFYDGTLGDLDKKLSNLPKSVASTGDNTVAYVVYDAKTSDGDPLYRQISSRVTVVKESVPKGGTFISVGGHVMLALGILDILANNRNDDSYLTYVANLAAALSGNVAKADEYKDMLKRGDINSLVIMLPPVEKIDIDRNMETYFAAEETAMKSL
jgi:hypothetical protein